MGLVRSGIGKANVSSLPQLDKWKDLYLFTQKQGIAAIVLDGINKYFENGVKITVDFQTKMEWIGQVHQMEQRYLQYETNISQLGSFYQKHGIRMMVVKGYGLLRIIQSKDIGLVVTLISIYLEIKKRQTGFFKKNWVL